MNKLLVDKEMVIENFKGIISFKTDEADLIIKGENELYISNEFITKLKITLWDNSLLVINEYNSIDKDTKSIDFILNNSTTLKYNYAFISKSNTNRSVITYINGNNNNSDIVVRNLAKSGKSNISVNIVVKEKTKDNVASEDVKTLNSGGLSQVSPHLEIHSNEVQANHFVAMGNVNKDNLYYLMSKGISEAAAKEILELSFLQSIFSDPYKKFIIGGE